MRYEADITGDCAPYKWKVYRLGPGIARVSPAGREGEAQTFEDACFEALESAREAEEIRRHGECKQTVRLFEVDQRKELPAPADDHARGTE